MIYRLNHAWYYSAIELKFETKPSNWFMLFVIFSFAALTLSKAEPSASRVSNYGGAPFGTHVTSAYSSGFLYLSVTYDSKPVKSVLLFF